MPLPRPNLDLMLACHLGDLEMASRAIAAGALADQAGLQGDNAFQACLKGPRPEMCIDIQLAAELATGRSPWRGRDGQNAASYIAMSARGGLMAAAIERLPRAVFERDAEGRTPFDLFCESCCARGADDEEAERAARMGAALCGPEQAESALRGCRIGLSIAEGLGGRADAGSPLLALLEARSIDFSLGEASRGSGSRRI